MRTKGLLFVIRHPFKLIRNILQAIAKSELVTPRIRVFLHQLRGVKFKDSRSVFIGPDVIFDGSYPPANITVGANVYITRGSKIIAHQYDPSTLGHKFIRGEVHIGDYVFIGFQSVIINASIGDYGVVGANAVVSKNVSPYHLVISKQQTIVKDRREGISA